MPERDCPARYEGLAMPTMSMVLLTLVMTGVASVSGFTTGSLLAQRY